MLVCLLILNILQHLPGESTQCLLGSPCGSPVLIVHMLQSPEGIHHLEGFYLVLL